MSWRVTVHHIGDGGPGCFYPPGMLMTSWTSEDEEDCAQKYDQVMEELVDEKRQVISVHIMDPSGKIKGYPFPDGPALQ